MEFDYAITNPVLPPKAGYVEVVDSEGNHVYQPTPQTAEFNEIRNTLTTLLGQPETDNEQAAVELNRAVQLFASALTDESQMMEIATVYPVYQVNHAYKTKDIFRYGLNSVGDPQLYQVLQDHTSAAEWLPDTVSSLYDAIGLTPSGYPVWSQPSGAHDAYNKGDIVSYNGVLYRSLIDGNTWSPDAYPAGWEVYVE